jgi:hypothetical protein
VAECERNVRRQREIVPRLERQGTDASVAKHLLRQFEINLAQRVEEGERLKNKNPGTE